jgi:hypothetical protein
MAPSAAPLEIGGGAREVSQGIEVRQARPNDEGAGAECGTFTQTAPRQSGANQRMAERVYSGLGSIGKWRLSLDHL